jgi:hypothetical protein
LTKSQAEAERKRFLADLKAVKKLMGATLT